MATQVADMTGNANLLADAPQSVLDELFAPSEVTPESSAPGQPQLAPTQPLQPDFFLKAGETVYKSADEAARGIAHKDSIISDLRQKWVSQFGVDPLTNQVVAKPLTPAQPQEPQGYLDNVEAAEAKLINAAQQLQAGQKGAYLNTLLDIVRELVHKEVVEPYGPAMTNFAQQQARTQVASDPEVKDFNQFVGSTAYQEVLEALPELKNAIYVAENDVRFQNALAGLYKTAYLASRGRRVGEIAQQAVTAAAAPKTAPTRPTTSPSTPTPTHAAGSGELTLATKAGRDAIIASFEGQGLHQVDMDRFLPK